MTPEVGDRAPDISLPSTHGQLRLLTLTKDKKAVLAFYCEDATPLCSTELAAFRDDYEFVRELGAEVVALSADSIESHRAFAERLGGVPYPLASDEALEAAQAFDVVDESGKRSRRAVFVIERGGRIAYAERWFQPGNPAQYEAVFRALGLKD